MIKRITVNPKERAERLEYDRIDRAYVREADRLIRIGRRRSNAKMVAYGRLLDKMFGCTHPGLKNLENKEK